MTTVIIAAISAIISGWIMYNYGRTSEKVDNFTDPLPLPDDYVEFGSVAHIPHNPVRISLTKEDFSALTAGQVLEPEPGVFICLKEMTYDLMMDILMDNKILSQ